MNRSAILTSFVLFFSFLFISLINGQNAYRLIDPIYGGRYGKSASAGPPFLRFGSTQQYYHTAASKYNAHTSAVSSSFNSWNNAGSVKYYSSSSSGLSLETFYSSYGAPDIVNPGEAYTAHNHYIINSSNSYIRLNTFHTWGTVQDLENDKFDVETILVHEIGHIHGLAHPLTNSYAHNASAPIMAGGDNQYFWNHTARSLRTDDINGTKFLQYNVWIPEQYTRIQTGINNSFPDGTVNVSSGTYNENISTSKDYFTLKGKGYNSTYINGYITFTNADHTNIKYLKTNTLSTNNSYTNLYSVKTNRFSIYGDEVQINYVRTNGGNQIPNQITNADGTVDNSNLENMMIGMDLTSNSAYNVQTYFCGNDADIDAFSGSVAYAWYNDAFSYNPDYSCSGNVYYIWKHTCGSNKQSQSSLQKMVSNSKSKSDLLAIDQNYVELLKNVNDKYLEKGTVDMNQFKDDYYKIIDNYKSFLEKYPSTEEAATAIFRTIHCYQQQDDYKGYDEFINKFLSDKKYDKIRADVERHNIDLKVEKGHYKEAIETANKIIDGYKIDSDLYCELLYEKGLIYKYHLENEIDAEKMFNIIIENYPKNKMASYAEIELGISGIKEEKSTEEQTTKFNNSSFSISSYPNPFNPSTTISYFLPSTSNVKLAIYDIMGRMIKSFTTDSQTSGKHQIVWDATNTNGSRIATGIYIYRFEATSLEKNKHFVKSAKLILLR